MASQGPLFPATRASLANAGTSENAEAWVNIANVGADDGSETQITAATFDSPDISQLIVASNFGFTIPAGSTINGIVVEVERRSIIASSGKDFRVQLATGTTFASLVGSNKAVPATIWPTSTGLATYGSSSDLWSAGLTVAQINAAGFAVMLSCQANIANADVGVDFIRVTVHYTPPTVVHDGELDIDATASVVLGGSRLLGTTVGLVGSGQLALDGSIAGGGGLTTYAADTFTRSVTDGLGSAETGGSYSISGTAADFDVNGSVAVISCPSSGTARTGRLLSVSARDIDYSNEVMIGEIAGSGEVIRIRLTLRRDASNLEGFEFRIRVNGSGSADVEVLQKTGGVLTSIAVANGAATLSSNDVLKMRFQLEGGGDPIDVRAKIWNKTTEGEPGAWDIDYDHTGPSAGQQAAGALEGINISTLAAWTGTYPHVSHWDNLLVTSIPTAGGGTQDGALAIEASGQVGASGSKLAGGIAALAGAGQLGAAGGLIAAGAIGLSGSGALAAAGSIRLAGALAVTGSGSLGSGGSLRLAGSLPLAGSGQLGLAGGLKTSGALAIGGLGSVTLGGTVRFAGALALTGFGDLALASGGFAEGSIALTGSGGLGAVAGTYRGGSAALAGNGALGPSGGLLKAGAMGLLGAGNVTAGGGLLKAGSAALSGIGSLAADGSLSGAPSSVAFGATGGLGLVGSVVLRGSIGIGGVGSFGPGGGVTMRGAMAIHGAGNLGLAGDVPPQFLPLEPGAHGSVTLAGLSGTVTLARGDVQDVTPTGRVKVL